MTKPHEQEWTAVQTNEGQTWVRIADGAHDPMRMVAVAMVYNPSLRGDLTGQARWDTEEAEGKRRAELMAAAPDMARALLDLGGTTESGWHTDVCIEYGHNDVCEAASAALRKAGVIS